MKSVSTDLHVQFSERPRLPDLPEGRLGRLLRELPCPNATGDELLKYGAAGGPIEGRTGVHEGLGDGPHASQVSFHPATVLEEAIRTSVNDGPVVIYCARQNFPEMPGAKLLAVFVLNTDEKELLRRAKMRPTIAGILMA